MNCGEKDCDGILDTSVEVRLRVSCVSFNVACVCNKCGRLHWRDGGEPVSNREGQRAFVVDGHLIHRDPLPESQTIQ